MYFVGMLALFMSYFFIMNFLGVSKTIQIGLLVIAFIFAFAYYFYQTYQSRISGKMLALGILKSKSKSTLDKVQEERIRLRMNDAISALKTSSLSGTKRGNAALYCLPWFAVIGPPANGKSTLLRNSGLNFPFSTDKKNNYKIQGVGGTRDYDWWFSDQAVFLDTAGRYTQCSTDRDQGEWFTFLSTLKKARRKAPLNGIIITLGLTDLMLQSKEELSETLQNISNRVQELYAQLGHLIPVYFVFTKIDRIAGFDDFFASMSEKEKHQIWGVNLSDYQTQENVFEFISQKFKVLVQQLVRSSFSKMALSRVKEKKEKIFDFPHQFQAAIKSVESLLTLFTEQNPYKEPIRIMGAYFISSTQFEGDLIKKHSVFSNTTQRGFSVIPKEEKDGAVTSFFVKDLFNKLLFKYSDFFSANKKTAQYLKRLKVLCFSGGCAFIAGLFMFYSLSLTANTALLREGEQKIRATIDALKHSPLSHERLAIMKDAIEHYNKLLSHKQNMPFYLRLGLYRGDSQTEFFTTLINDGWLTSVIRPINNVLLTRLNAYARQWERASQKEKMFLRGEYYTTLKAYMMLVYPLYLDVEFASQQITPLWHADMLKKAPNKELMQSSTYYSFMKYYLTKLKNNTNGAIIIRPNIALINHARHQLYSPTNASNLYALIKTRGTQALETFTVSQLLNDYGLELLDSTKTIQKFYTVDGWKNYVSPHIEKVVQGASEVDWVIDVPLHNLRKVQSYRRINSGLAAKFKGQMIELYLSEYADAWLRFLSSIHVEKFTSLEDAAAQYRMLYQTQGPIIQLFEKLKQEISITELIDVQYMPSYVQKTFNGLQKISQVKGKMLESYLKELAAIQSDLERMSGSPDLSRDTLDYAQGILSSRSTNMELQKGARLIDKLLGDVDSLATRKLLKPLLLSPIQEAWRIVLLEAKRGLDQHWYDEVFRLYQSELRNKFPFSHSEEEVAQADMVEFFRKGDGVLWGFIHDKLLTFIENKNDKFTNKTWLDIGLGLSDDFLSSLSFAQKISDGLFKGDKFGFNFYVYPEPTMGLNEILFESGRKYFRYQNGPQEWVNFSWPGDNSAEGALLRLSPSQGESKITLEFLNMWGVVHLFEKAKLTQLSKSKFKASWSLQGKDGKTYIASLYVRGEGRNSILNALLFNKKSLPKYLFETSGKELF